MKKAITRATLWYFAMWGIFGVSFCLWYFGAGDSAITQQTISILRDYFNILPFQWTLTNCSAFLFAFTLFYVIFIGFWLGVDWIIDE